MATLRPHEADVILAGFDAVRRQAARRLLVQLVALDDGARTDRRRRVSFDQLRRGTPAEAAVFGEVLERLAHERLLVLSKGDDGAWPTCRRSDPAAQGAGAVAGRCPIVEIAHEQLLRSWRTLRTWLREDERRLLELQQLDRWVAEAKGFPEYVLDADRLRHARGLLKKYPDDVGEAARALIRRSEKAARRRRSWLLALGLVAVVADVVVVTGLAMAAAAPPKESAICSQDPPASHDAGAASPDSGDAATRPPVSSAAPSSKPKTPIRKPPSPVPSSSAGAAGSARPVAKEAPSGRADASNEAPDGGPGTPNKVRGSIRRPFERDEPKLPYIR
ncbi:uncharacterized protein SOCE26_066200 [Sorangium cellulosum]|uniref:Novel STAND NTPase 1 domain-containing protein n=1 Tax=Sorangium cellulosum TaxID=56 RepID=A0A2L0F0Y5_SORCE|nr:hypothetical protein [Sorangium cellulosum]AUX45139.1 uncharacterized protein SOCE26_066200 [Sorangium cellulosum]